MGFFSAIKKIFGAAEGAAAPETQADINAVASAPEGGQAASTHADASSASQPPASGPLAAGPADEALTLRLREAEPRLSVWLGIVLEDVDEAGDLLWRRLSFLLRALDAPEAEAQNFVRDFQGWLARMDYRQVEEFLSELQ